MTLRPLLGGLSGLRAAGGVSAPSTSTICLRLPQRNLSSYTRRPSSGPSLSSSSSSRPPCQLGLRSAPAHRTLFTEALEGLSSAVGATPLPGLLAASPLPLWGTIAVLALTVRGCITFPLQLWQRRRVWRTRAYVIPEMKRINDELAVTIARQARKDGLGYKEYLKLLKDELADRQAELHKKHRTHPTITLLVPLAVSVPLFIVMSMTIRQAVTAYPELAMQSFQWIKHMGEPDPQWILPMAAGMLGFANAEMSDSKFAVRRELEAASKAKAVEAEDDVGATSTATTSTSAGVASATALSSAAGPKPSPAPFVQKRRLSSTPPAAANPKPPAKSGPKQYGQRRVNRPVIHAQIPSRGAAPAAKVAVRMRAMPTEADMVEEKTWVAKLMPQNRGWVHKMLTWTMRGASFLVTIVGLQMPAAVVWYWTMSMSFTLAQNFYFDQVDKKERARLDALKAGTVA